MKSKRAALWMIIGGIAMSGFGSTVSNVSAEDASVRNAGFLQRVDAEDAELKQIAFFSCKDDACDELPCGCDGACDCDPYMSSDCDDGCDSAGCLANGMNCDLGDPFTLFGSVGSISVGGWAQFGYHNKALPLFNSRPNEFQAHQFWLYAEKTLDTSEGFDIGGRIDYVYGTDAQDTQSFGIANDHWDNDWDNGGDNGYGHALPQLYGEVGYGDLSVKVGHFYTIIGWEVVTAPDNFFYSHAYTMYNSEPFTHSGALATWNIGDDLTAYGGYTLGWDSGFEDNGDAFLGGASLAVSENLTVTYAATGGRFNEGDGERGYMHSIVSDVTLTDKLQFIGQTDILATENAAGQTVRDSIGYNSYLLYTMSDCLAVGGRLEYWENESGGENFDYLDLTLGINFKPHANILVRPEIRWDWVDGDLANLAASGGPMLDGNRDEQTTFGIDTIFTF